MQAFSEKIFFWWSGKTVRYLLFILYFDIIGVLFKKWALPVKPNSERQEKNNFNSLMIVARTVAFIKR